MNCILPIKNPHNPLNDWKRKFWSFKSTNSKITTTFNVRISLIKTLNCQFKNINFNILIFHK